jgi:UDP-glucose 4-epimerase
MRILVTGASGFLGKAIVAELLRENFEVYGLGSLRTREGGGVDGPNFLRADITDRASLGRVESIGQVDVVIHAAGLAHQFGPTAAEKFRAVNVEGTRNVASLAARLNAVHFILISSVAVYGNSKLSTDGVLIEEDSACAPESVYAESKLESEKAAAETCAENSIGLTILRPATIIGENDRGNTARLIKAVDRRKFLWIGKGENRKSLIYKDDVAAACLSVLRQKTIRTEIFNVTAAPISMKEIVSEIALGLDRTIPKIVVPPGLLKSLFRVNEKSLKVGKIQKISGTIEKWLSDDVFSGEKIAREYGFRAATPIEEALRRQVASYRSRESEKSREGRENRENRK